jgi:hypothetical protein
MLTIPGAWAGERSFLQLSAPATPSPPAEVQQFGHVRIIQFVLRDDDRAANQPSLGRDLGFRNRSVTEGSPTAVQPVRVRGEASPQPRIDD